MERAQLACVRVGKGGAEKLSHEMRCAQRAGEQCTTTTRQKGKRAFIQEGQKPRDLLPILRPFAAAFVKVPGKVTVGTSSTSGSMCRLNKFFQNLKFQNKSPIFN